MTDLCNKKESLEDIRVYIFNSIPPQLDDHPDPHKSYKLDFYRRVNWGRIVGVYIY